MTWARKVKSQAPTLILLRRPKRL